MENQFSNAHQAPDLTDVEYPPEPWRLQGGFTAAFRLVDTAAARLFIDPKVSILPVLPGKTLAGAGLFDYAPGSTLTYRELIVFPGLVHFRGRIGLWISHIYVDDLSSLKGGRELFGVPKELASFDWEKGTTTRIQVRQGSQVLLALTSRKDPFNIRMPIWSAAMGNTAGDLRWFTSKGWGHGWKTSVRILVPPGSPFAELDLEKAEVAIEMREVSALIGGIRSLK